MNSFEQPQYSQGPTEDEVASTLAYIEELREDSKNGNPDENMDNMVSKNLAFWDNLKDTDQSNRSEDPFPSQTIKLKKILEANLDTANIVYLGKFTFEEELSYLKENGKTPFDCIEIPIFNQEGEMENYSHLYLISQQE